MLPVCCSAALHAPRVSCAAHAGTSVPHMPHSMCHALLRTRSGMTLSFEAILSESPLSPQPWFIIQCEQGEIVIDGAFDGGFGVKVRCCELWAVRVTAVSAAACNA